MLHCHVIRFVIFFIVLSQMESNQVQEYEEADRSSLFASVARRHSDDYMSFLQAKEDRMKKEAEERRNGKKK